MFCCGIECGSDVAISSRIPSELVRTLTLGAAIGKTRLGPGAPPEKAFELWRQLREATRTDRAEKKIKARSRQGPFFAIITVARVASGEREEAAFQSQHQGYARFLAQTRLP